MNLFDALFPAPKWILTDYTSKRLKEINPVYYNNLVSGYNNDVAETSKAYASIIPNTISGITQPLITPVVIIGVMAIGILYLWKK